MLRASGGVTRQLFFSLRRPFGLLAMSRIFGENDINDYDAREDSFAALPFRACY
jgi:hypothetical protein